jgi:membrane fusion protein (multidrug efflux system)
MTEVQLSVSPKKTLVKTIVLWVAGVVALVALVAWTARLFNERVSPSAEVAIAPLPLPFAAGKTLEVIESPYDVIERFPGTVRAIRETVISSRIIAEVRDVVVRAGDRVRSGDTLVVLDDRDLQSRVAQAIEFLTGAEAQHREAEREFERTKSLRERGTVAESVLESAEATFLSARAARESAARRLEETRIELSHARIEAPFDAVITDRFAEPGDISAPGSPLVKLYDPSRMRLESAVRETLALRLERGGEVDIRIESIDLDVRGRIDEIVPRAEAGSRSFLVKVDIQSTTPLFPGTFGRLLLKVETRKRVLVPAAAVVGVGQLDYVILADGRNTRRVVVAAEVSGGDQVEILSGLVAGERILTPATI